jgi:hypothetical protein
MTDEIKNYVGNGRVRTYHEIIGELQAKQAEKLVLLEKLEKAIERLTAQRDYYKRMWSAQRAENAKLKKEEQ